MRPHYDPEGGGFNCEPFYFSVMNYLYEGEFGTAGKPVTFVDRHVINRVAINNTKLVERNAIRHYLNNPLDSVFQFMVSNLRERKYPVSPAGDVDWNRDGVISDAPVAAGSNRMGGTCDEARANQASFDGRWNGARSLAAASFGGVIQLAGVDRQNNAWWGGVQFNARCTNFDNEACSTLFPPPVMGQRIHLFNNVTGVDIAVLESPTLTRRPVAFAIKQGTSTIRFAQASAAVPVQVPLPPSLPPMFQSQWSEGPGGSWSPLSS